MAMYAISAIRYYTKEDDDGYTWESFDDLPTFYLDENVQGIISEEHAKKIALDILGSGKYRITVVKIGD